MEGGGLQLFLGDTNRMIAETPMNPASSRSHCIFVIHIEGREVRSLLPTTLPITIHALPKVMSHRIHMLLWGSQRTITVVQPQALMRLGGVEFWQGGSVLIHSYGIFQETDRLQMNSHWWRQRQVWWSFTY